MEIKPIHTHNTKYYHVLRPILWFASGSKITYEEIQEYFTQKAIKSLLKYEYIVICNNCKSKN